MQNFMIAYYGGKRPNSKEEGMAHMNKWKAWIEELGDSVVNPGTPLAQTKIISANNVQDETDSDAMKGFAVIRAETIEAAIEISKKDPFLETQGTIRVSHMVEMK